MRFSNRERRRWVMALLLLGAAALRVAGLQDVPPGLARDETLNADIATWIWSGYHRLFFRDGFGHEPLYHYIGAPFIQAVGDNVLAIRLPSVFLGLLLVALAYRWVSREWGSLAGLVTAALLSVSGWPLVFSRVGLRPILLPVLLMGVTLNWRRRPWLAGLFLGLTLYSYTAARVMLALPLLMVAHHLVWRGPVWRRQARRAGVILAVALLVGLPLYLTLRADPTLQQRLDQLSGPLEALQAGDPGPIIENTLRTAGFFAFSGDPLWSYLLPNRPVFDPLTATLFAVGLLLTAWRARQNERDALVLAWFGLALIPSAAAPDAPSSIRLIAALPVTYLMPAVAVDALVKYTQRRADRRRLAPALGVALASLLLILAAARTWRDGYQTWAAAPDVRLKYQSIWLDISRDWRANPTDALVVADAFFEPVKADSLRRDAGRPVPARWVQQQNAVVVPAERPAALYVPEFAPPHTRLLELVGTPRPEFRSTAFPSFALYRLIAPPRPPTISLAASFAPAGQPAALSHTGYDLTWSGDTPVVITFWRVLAPLPHDLTTFLHVVDGNGDIVAQYDGFDAVPATLREDDIVLQHHPLPSLSADGSLRLQLGVYTLSDGSRWLIDGAPRDILILVDGLTDNTGL